MSSDALINKKNSQRPCALLWDESFLWGIIARRALINAGLPFDLIRSEDIRAGILSRYRMIFVPGGWAKSKRHLLGSRGQAEICSFVHNGGSYLGICGGAGLATENDLGLLPLVRKSGKERIPSFSGPILLSHADHAIWNDIVIPVFFAWWPPQFRISGSKNDLRILAVFNKAQAEAMSSNIPVRKGRTDGWVKYEETYGIFLNPERLSGEPAVVEGYYGCGKVLLSLVHFDTPGDRNGEIVLRNLWSHLLSGASDRMPECEIRLDKRPVRVKCPKSERVVTDLLKAVEELVAMGEQYLLWNRRHSWLLRWNRGIRGMEISTLSAMIGEIASYLRTNNKGMHGPEKQCPDLDNLQDDLMVIRKLLLPFLEKNKKLLDQEKTLQTVDLSRSCPGHAAIGQLREELFGNAVSFGGEFKEVIDIMDQLLYKLYKISE